jgi:hypothetical protein
MIPSRKFGPEAGKFRPEPRPRCGVYPRLSIEMAWNLMELDGTAMEEGMMWIGFFSIASAAAICLSVAAVMVQANQGDILRS